MSAGERRPTDEGSKRRRIALEACVVLAAFTLAADGGAEPRRRRRPPPPAPRPRVLEASTATGSVALMSPAGDRLLVRAGSFTMGASNDEVQQALRACQHDAGGDPCDERTFSNEVPAHQVALSDFWIDRAEVTVARFRRCVVAGVCAPPPTAAGGARFDAADLPVTLVTWQDAATYCAWDGGRLPTEAEWERAARGPGAGRRFPWGNVWNGALANHGRGTVEVLEGPHAIRFLRFEAWDLDRSDGFRELAPTGSYSLGATVDGIVDLAGNVEEWVADWYAEEYPAASQSDPKGPDTGDERVVRGGSYAHGRSWLRTTARAAAAPASRRTWRGFRCAWKG